MPSRRNQTRSSMTRKTSSRGASSARGTRKLSNPRNRLFSASNHIAQLQQDFHINLESTLEQLQQETKSLEKQQTQLTTQLSKAKKKYQATKEKCAMAEEAYKLKDGKTQLNRLEKSKAHHETMAFQVEELTRDLEHTKITAKEAKDALKKYTALAKAVKDFENNYDKLPLSKKALESDETYFHITSEDNPIPADIL